MQNILDQAHAAAALAIAAEVAKRPEGNDMDCGFAWVNISGTSPLARYCRKLLKEAKEGKRVLNNPTSYYGHKSYSTGWDFWKPGAYAGQSIRFHEAGARAFRDKLAEFNIRADMLSRYD